MRDRSCPRVRLALRFLFAASAGAASAGAEAAGAEGLLGNVELGFEAEAGFGRRLWSEEFFTSTGSAIPEGAFTLAASAEPSLAAEILPGLAFSVRAGIEGEGLVDDPAAATLRASVPEAAFSLRPAEGVFIRVGILPLPPGPDPFFKPAQWLSRFTANAYAKGGTSFLGLQASIYLGDAKLGLLCLPEIRFPVHELFRKPESLVIEGRATGSAAEARLSYSLFGGSAALFGFCQSESRSLSPRSGGLGLEAAFPIGDRADLRAEGLYSSGLPRYVTGGCGLSLAAGSTRDWGLAYCVSAGATAFSFLELRAAYSYAGRGLPASAWASPALWAEGKAIPRHDLSLFLGLPRITDALGLSIFALVSPEDFSSSYYLELSLEEGEASRFRLRGDFSPSAAGSLHGSSPIKGSLSILADITYREKL